MKRSWEEVLKENEELKDKISRLEEDNKLFKKIIVTFIKMNTLLSNPVMMVPKGGTL